MTYFTGQPLFGKDSSPHRTSKILGFFATSGLWLVFLICMIFIKPVEKAPKYKEVQIVLESTSTPEHKEETPKAIATPSAAATPEHKADASAGKVDSPARKVDLPASKVDSPAPEEDLWDDFEYALDPMEAFAQQTSSSPKEDVNWDEMFGETTSNAGEKNSNKVVTGGNEFSGSAGKVSGSKNSKVTSAQVGGGSAENWEASRATSSALGDISNTRFVGTSSADLSSATTVQATTAGDGKVYIKMSNGRARALLKPSEPGIKLSKEAESSIDGSKSVKIKFMVTKTGNVPSTQISITPAALLPAIVQQEIKAQISQWVFESDNYDAFAEFEYNIVKK